MIYIQRNKRASEYPRTEVYKVSDARNQLLADVSRSYPDVNLDSLFKRLDGVKEVIVATPFTVEGEMTAMYLDRVLKDKGVLVTRLAQGLPMGASLDYADDWTLTNALNNRKGMTND